MKKWFMLTLVGEDQPGIVAQISAALYQNGCNLGEASMARLGGNFTIMLMVQYEGGVEALGKSIAPICDSLGLRWHVDEIEGELHHHVEPNVRISVYGADRAGIVAEATNVLAEAGLNILNLESDVGGTSEDAIYIMHIEGVAVKGIDVLQKALEVLAREKDVETRLSPVDTLMG